MRFTCLIPTFNNGAMIRASIESVLEQTVADLELFVVCDGAPEITHRIADEIASQDARVRVFKFEKGERHGEASRHRALQEATGEVVCYLSDDDYWFPDHLEIMSHLLADADFAHTRHTVVYPSFEFRAVQTYVADADARERMCAEVFNIFGPTVVGHRLSAYRRLPEGWAPAPKTLPTDLHMWRKWLRAEGVRFAASAEVTTLHIPRSIRGHHEHDASVREADYWRAAFRDPLMREALRELVPIGSHPLPAARVARRACELHRRRVTAADELQRVYATRTWRYTAPLRRMWRYIRDMAKLDG